MYSGLLFEALIWSYICFYGGSNSMQQTFLATKTGSADLRIQSWTRPSAPHLCRECCMMVLARLKASLLVTWGRWMGKSWDRSPAVAFRSRDTHHRVAGRRPRHRNCRMCCNSQLPALGATFQWLWWKNLPFSLLKAKSDSTEELVLRYTIKLWILLPGNTVNC